LLSRVGHLLNFNKPPEPEFSEIVLIVSEVCTFAAMGRDTPTSPESGADQHDAISG